MDALCSWLPRLSSRVVRLLDGHRNRERGRRLGPTVESCRDDAGVVIGDPCRGRSKSSPITTNPGQLPSTKLPRIINYGSPITNLQIIQPPSRYLPTVHHHFPP